MLTPGSLAAAVAGHPALASEGGLDEAEAVEKLTRVAHDMLVALDAAGVKILVEKYRPVVEAAEKWKP